MSLLAVEVPAFLRQHLIFDVHGTGAGLFEGADHVHDVQCFAVAGVAVDQQRQRGRPNDLADEESDLLDRYERRPSPATPPFHCGYREAAGCPGAPAVRENAVPRSGAAARLRQGTAWSFLYG
jgi:hypothetical protein